jgi:hypothetical protein
MFYQPKEEHTAFFAKTMPPDASPPLATKSLFAHLRRPRATGSDPMEDRLSFGLFGKDQERAFLLMARQLDSNIQQKSLISRRLDCLFQHFEAIFLDNCINQIARMI